MLLFRIGKKLNEQVAFRFSFPSTNLSRFVKYLGLSRLHSCFNYASRIIVDGNGKLLCLSVDDSNYLQWHVRVSAQHILVFYSKETHALRVDIKL